MRLMFNNPVDCLMKAAQELLQAVHRSEFFRAKRWFPS